MPPASPTADEFVAAFARHGRALWVLAAAWVGRGEAADLVQEAARIGWQRRAQCASHEELGPWLAQIVRHAGANWRRKKQPAASDPSALPEPAARIELAAHESWAALREALPDDLARALASLPEVARACLLLHVVADLSFAEIAAMLEVPENTAMSHARRARLALQVALQPSTALAPSPELP